MYVYTYLNTCTNMHICNIYMFHRCFQTGKCLCVWNMCMYIYTFINICTYICIYMHTFPAHVCFIDASRWANTGACGAYIYLYIHTYIYVHTYIFVYAYIYATYMFHRCFQMGKCWCGLNMVSTQRSAKKKTT